MLSQSARKDAKFWNRIAKRYSNKPVPDQRVYDEKLTRSDAYLSTDYQVLELGCGTGSTALHHAPKVKHILATDISDSMIAIAEEKASAAGITNVNFEIATIDDVINTAQTFDVILAHSLLHLLQNPDVEIQKIRTLLNSGGLLITSTPCISEFMPLMRYVFPLGRFVGLMPYIGVFSEAQLHTWFTDAGFELEERWLPAPKSGVYLVHRLIS
ncbi:MAG: methyltransferase domain-containing protein [Pseudomonadota bacterium]